MTVVSHGNGNTAPNPGLPEGMDPQNIAEVVGALMGQPAMLAMILSGNLQIKIHNDSVLVIPVANSQAGTPAHQIDPNGPAAAEAAPFNQATFVADPPVVTKKPPETPPVGLAPQYAPEAAPHPHPSPESIVTNRHESQSVPVSQPIADAQQLLDPMLHPDQQNRQPEALVVLPKEEKPTPPMPPQQSAAPATTIDTPVSERMTAQIHEVDEDEHDESQASIKAPLRGPFNAARRQAPPQPQPSPKISPKPAVAPQRKSRPRPGDAADYMPIGLAGAKDRLPSDVVIVRPSDKRKEAIRNLTYGAFAVGAVAAATYGTVPHGTVGAQAAEAAGAGLQEVGSAQIITGDGRSAESVSDRLQAAVNKLGIKDGRDIKDVAEKLSRERGYKITARELAEANPTIRDAKTGKEHKLDVKHPDRDVEARLPVGNLEIKVPAPIAQGQAVTEAGDTVNSVAAELKMSVADLRKLNPDLPAKDNVFIPNETVIWTKAKPDPNMVLQVATEATEKEVNILLSVDDATRKKILEANPGVLDDGIQPGEEVYIPLKQTPEMKAADIKPQEIIEANKPAYTDPEAPRIPQPETVAKAPAVKKPATKPTETKPPQAQTTKVPERPASVSKLTPEQAIVEQDRIIDSLDINGKRKTTLKKLVHSITVLQSGAEAKGVNMSVMTAQSILESGWGDSTLASEHNNWFGNKANDGWKGRSVTVQTNEHVNGKDIRIPDAFRSYDNVSDGFNDYIDKMVGKSFYEDALRYPTDARMFVSGLVNSLNKDGVIVGKQGSDGVSSYATDPRYVSKIMQLVDKLHLTEIYDLSRTQAVSSAGYTVPAKKKPETVTTQPGTTNKIIGKGAQVFDVVLPDTSGGLNPRDYSDIQNPLPKNNNKKALIDADDNKDTGLRGKEKRSKDIGARERLGIISREISQIETSKEGFESFKAKKFIDVRDEVRAKYPYFRGDHNGLGKPKKNSDIKGMVIHFTATNTPSNNMDGVRFASSVHNAGDHLGMQLFLNDQGTGYRLTDDFTNHTLSYNGTRHNGKWYGLEVAASEQGEISNEQYTALIYMMADFLIKHDFVQPGESIDSAITTMIKGHREANPGKGYHHDFPGIVMDRMRGELTKFMVKDLGYTTKLM